MSLELVPEVDTISRTRRTYVVSRRKSPIKLAMSKLYEASACYRWSVRIGTVLFCLALFAGIVVAGCYAISKEF